MRFPLFRTVGCFGAMVGPEGAKTPGSGSTFESPRPAARCALPAGETMISFVPDRVQLRHAAPTRSPFQEVLPFYLVGVTPFEAGRI
jgi:hypothetical protein